MSNEHTYRAKAAEFLALARTEKDPIRLAELQNLARQYVRLAQQASRNRHVDLAYEAPSQSPSEAPDGE